MQLDGIEKGSDPTKWQSLVSEDSIPISVAQTDDNGLNLPPAINNILPTAQDNLTVEFCLNALTINSNDINFILPVQDNQLMLRCYSKRYWQYYQVRNTDIKNCWQYINWQNPVCTMSFRNSSAIINGLKSTDGVHLGSSLWSQPAIGSQKAFKFYSIRIYNRQLTEDEILYNQRVDNLRFNLGLDLNGGIQPYTPGRALTMSRDLALDEASPLESFDESLSTEEEECVVATER